MMASHTTLQERFVELRNARITRTYPRPYSRPKIQRVPEHLRNRKEFKEHYLPRLVSIGPIHHENKKLNLGEKYKLMWAAQYIDDNGLDSQNLYKKIANNIDHLKGLFAEDVLTGTRKSLKGFPSLNEKLSWMLFVDGCSLLHILVKNADFNNSWPMNIKVDNSSWDMNIKVDTLFLVMRDVLLLENQLPYPVLKLLWINENETELINIMKKFLNRREPWAKPGKPKNKKTELKDAMKVFVNLFWGNHGTKLKDTTGSTTKKNVIKCHNWATPDTKRTCWGSVTSHIQCCFEVENKKKEEEVWVSIPNELELNRPIHLLDFQRKIILATSSSKTEGQKSQEEHTSEMITYRNIQDLRAVGIKFKSSATRSPKDIYFSEGWFAAELILPEIVVDGNTAASFINLIAYEMCPDFNNEYEISSFVIFMDSLIDHPDDVRKLRSKGILLNCLGSDEEVAKLFNIISTDLVEAETYFRVRVKIDKHYKHKCKTWIALGIHTYFNNPWTVTAFLVAFIALALTFVQTLFTINPSEQKK